MQDYFDDDELTEFETIVGRRVYGRAVPKTGHPGRVKIVTVDPDTLDHLVSGRPTRVVRKPLEDE